MHSIELKTPSGIVLFAQVMEPLATEPLVVLTSASPIVGELLGENRFSVRHSATGYASGPRRTSAPHTGHRPPPQKPDRPMVSGLYGRDTRAARKPYATASGAESALSAVSLGLPRRTAASMRSRDDR